MKNLALLICLVASHNIVSVYGQTYGGIGNVYPISDNNGQRILAGHQHFPGLSDEQIFANVLKWSINEYCKDKRDGLSDIQVDKKTFSIATSIDYTADGKRKYVFYYKATIKVTEGEVVYTLYDIHYKSSGILSLSSNSLLDKLNPDKKPKHREIISAFQDVASKKLNAMFDAIVANQCQEISHWGDINNQRPVKGMNEDECYLALGKPSNNFEDNNNRPQWSYGLNLVLVFIEGKLEQIIR